MIEYNVQGTHLMINKTFANKQEAEAFARHLSKKDTAIYREIKRWQYRGESFHRVVELKNFFVDGVVKGNRF